MKTVSNSADAKMNNFPGLVVINKSRNFMALCSLRDGVGGTGSLANEDCDLKEKLSLDFQRKSS